MVQGSALRELSCVPGTQGEWKELGGPTRWKRGLVEVVRVGEV